MTRELSANSTLSHYRIVSKIGAGGMGEVYLAEDIRLGRKVALKILATDLTKHEDRVRRFEQEARAASALSHPNILTIFDIGTEDSTHFIATEFIDGPTLRSVLTRARMKLGAVLDIALQAASALAAAHTAGIIHRDIKPENIMVRPDGLVKVLDFGLAKLIEAQAPSTDSGARTIARADTDPGTVMGTAAYMSPEQARGQNVDARTDIFSLGVVIYEMIAGRAPFEGETASHVIVSILEKEPAPLTRSSPDTPSELDRIVTKALAKDKDERYQTVKDLLIDLKKLKQRRDLDAEIERSISPDTISRSAVATSSGPAAAVTAATSVTSSSDVAARTTSSAEYLVSGIKQHKRGVNAALALLVIAIVALVYFFYPASSVAINSIAVLPLANAGSDPNMEYVSDGISESLINSLSQLQRLRVTARSTAFRYKGKEVDPQQVGRELHVQTVLMGRVRQLGDRLDVQVDLVDTTTGAQLWGAEYEHKLSDVLVVKQAIAREVTEKLRLKLTRDEQKRFTKDQTENTEAYLLYLRGRYHTARYTKEDLNKGLDYFRQAIAMDPRYALAYDGLAYYYLTATDWFLPAKESLPKAGDAARKALELDDTLAEAHTSLAIVHWWFDWDWPAAETEFKRSIELNPNDARAHEFYGWYLITMGRADAGIQENKRAQALDPLSVETNTLLGQSLYFARRYDQAIEQLRNTLDMDQSYWLAHSFLGRTYEQQGKLAEAIAEFQRALQIENAVAENRAMIGNAYGLLGRRGEAGKIIDELKHLSLRSYVPPYNIATIYAGLGDKDQAFVWFDRAYADRSFYMTWIKVDPQMDSLRSDPRFTDLLRRVGLPQ